MCLPLCLSPAPHPCPLTKGPWLLSSGAAGQNSGLESFPLASTRVSECGCVPRHLSPQYGPVPRGSPGVWGLLVGQPRCTAPGGLPCTDPARLCGRGGSVVRSYSVGNRKLIDRQTDRHREKRERASPWAQPGWPLRGCGQRTQEPASPRLTVLTSDHTSHPSPDHPGSADQETPSPREAAPLCSV